MRFAFLSSFIVNIISGIDNPNLELSPTDLPHLPLLLLDNFDLIPNMGVALRFFTTSIIL